MWKAERLASNTVMVLVPSISLVSQTRKEWNAQLRDDIVELCVCSDETAGKQDDSIQYNVKDMLFPATTDVKIIRKFLKHKTNKLKVIFSTYHSAHVVAEAMNSRGIKAIDLGIYDEAHRTASTGSMFSYALSNSNIKINKRLFMTATPKHYKISKDKLEKLGDDIKIVSMDNEKLYGSVVYRMSFKEAVDRGLIVPLKVVVSMVTRQDVAEWIADKEAATNVKGEDINVKWVVGQIAHAKARKKFGITKSISYLSRISQAEDYASDTPRGLKNFVKNIETYCASSNQNSTEREAVLRSFADSPYADIANARCLTEGVDLPSVDMVMFVHPRKSHIDIVQAVGRPMRLAPGKKCGYVLVPLYVDQQKGETFEEAVERTSQETLVDVINAVREHDEDLTAIIQQLRRARGESDRPYSPRILKDKIEFIGPRVKLKTLEKAVTTLIVNKLASPWEENYGRIVAYQKKFGRGKFPVRGEKGWDRESSWLSTQRAQKNKGVLDPRREALLDKIGMVWDVGDEMFRIGVELFKKFGDVPRGFKIPKGTKIEV
jgi:predicted helicase